MIKPDYTSPDGRIRCYNCSYEELFKMGTTWDLAIVDPEYGISIENSGTHFKKYETKGWDSKIPTKGYFEELKRVSKNQIIWGGNYFLDYLNNTKCMIVWDKKIAEKMSFAMCEIAWTSLNKGAKIYSKIAAQNDRIHPTQKPVKLYRWLLKNYAKPNQSIIDTHGGSMSHAIAVHYINIALDMNLTLDICEIDTDYFNDAVKRFKTHIAQKQLF